MKSRIVFLCTLAAFLSPMSVMALESAVLDPSLHDCSGWAAEVAKNNAIAKEQGVTNPLTGKKIQTSVAAE